MTQDQRDILALREQVAAQARRIISLETALATIELDAKRLQSGWHAFMTAETLVVSILAICKKVKDT